jgi:hypothetical protein
MVGSITKLHNQMAIIVEDPALFDSRCPDNATIPIDSSDEMGPAVRERTYARAHHADRTRMRSLEDAVNQNIMKGARSRADIRFLFQ